MENFEKKYKEALEKARQLCVYPTTKPFISDLQDLFPELKKDKGSDDERIRKEIVSAINIYCSEYHRGTKVRNDMLAWLEKQDKETSWKPSKEEMDALYGLAYITNQYDEHKEEVITRLYQDLKREFFNVSSYENMFPNTEDGVRRRSTIQILEYARSLDNYNQYGKADIDKNIAWLEKQGEQKQNVNMQIEPSEYINDMGGNGCYLKNTAQTSAWSDEDKEYLASCIEVIDNFYKLSREVKTLTKINVFRREYAEKLKSWLKSLKDRYIWKPTEEQIMALKWALNRVPYDSYTEKLHGLLEQLKRL